MEVLLHRYRRSHSGRAVHCHWTKVLWRPGPELGIYSWQKSNHNICATRNGPRKWLTINSKIMSTQSSKTSKSPSRYSVGMFSAGEARCDRWQDLAHAGQTLVAQSSSDSSTKETLATVEALLAPLSALETFRAYPGEAMMTALKDALGRRDYSS